MGAGHSVCRGSSRMKFRFCGELDAPDWLLADIALLSKISSLRFKLMCVQVIDELFGKKAVDFEKVDKHTAEANYSVSDVKASMAAIRFIVSNAVKYDVEEGVLKHELQQLGLPKEHSDALGRPYRDQQDTLRHSFSENAYRLTQVGNVDWRVAVVLGHSGTTAWKAPSVSLKFNVTKPEEGVTKPVVFEASAEKLQMLLSEMKAARAVMGELEGE